MPLVNMCKMLNEARKGKYAVGQFNINNLEWTKTILETAQKINHPLFLACLKVLQNIWADLIL